MNAEEITNFLDKLTTESTENSERLEDILKLRTTIGENSQHIQDLTSEVDKLNTEIVAKEELVRKYEKMIQDYIKSTPVTTVITERDTVSDYEDFIND